MRVLGGRFLGRTRGGLSPSSIPHLAPRFRFAGSQEKAVVATPRSGTGTSAGTSRHLIGLMPGCVAIVERQAILLYVATQSVARLGHGIHYRAEPMLALVSARNLRPVPIPLTVLVDAL